MDLGQLASSGDLLYFNRVISGFKLFLKESLLMVSANLGLCYSLCALSVFLGQVLFLDKYITAIYLSLSKYQFWDFETLALSTYLVSGIKF